MSLGFAEEGVRFAEEHVLTLIDLSSKDIGAEGTKAELPQKRWDLERTCKQLAGPGGSFEGERAGDKNGSFFQ